MSIKLPLYLVDDDEAILDSLGFMLGQFGYQVQTFNSGRDFLEHCALSQAGCVILDSRMPEITGQEVQQKLLCGNLRVKKVAMLYMILMETTSMKYSSRLDQEVAD